MEMVTVGAFDTWSNKLGNGKRVIARLINALLTAFVT